MINLIYYTQYELVGNLSMAGFVGENVGLGKALGMAGDMEPWIVVTSSVTIRGPIVLN